MSDVSDAPIGAGRPSDYKPEYCQVLEDQLSQGYSVEAAAGELGVAKSTLYRWLKDNEELRNAKERGLSKSRQKWEDFALTSLESGVPINASVWIFNMKNRFGWRDKQEIVSDNKHTVQLAYKVD